MREFRTSGSVRGRGGNSPVYSTEPNAEVLCEGNLGFAPYPDSVKLGSGEHRLKGLKIFAVTPRRVHSEHHLVEGPGEALAQQPLFEERRHAPRVVAEGAAAPGA